MVFIGIIGPLKNHLWILNNQNIILEQCSKIIGQLVLNHEFHELSVQKSTDT